MESSFSGQTGNLESPGRDIPELDLSGRANNGSKKGVEGSKAKAAEDINTWNNAITPKSADRRINKKNLEASLPFIEGFPFVAENWTQNIFDNSPISCLDFHPDRHAWRKLRLFAPDINNGLLQSYFGGIY